MILCSAAPTTPSRIEGLANALFEWHIDMIALDVVGNPSENWIGCRYGIHRIATAFGVVLRFVRAHRRKKRLWLPVRFAEAKHHIYPRLFSDRL